jgi:hypothetical protein
VISSPAILLFIGLGAQNPDSSLAVYRRQVVEARAAWERGRACVADTVRLHAQVGRQPADVARAWADRFARDTTLRRVSYDACVAALSGGPASYVAPPIPPQAAAALKPRRPAPFSDGPFDQYTWVFYADLALGTLLGTFTALFLTRTLTAGWRVALTVIGAGVGGMIGAAVFIPFMFLSALFMFLSPPEPPLLFGMTALVLLGAAIGGVGGLLSRRRRWVGVDVLKRRLGVRR